MEMTTESIYIVEGLKNGDNNTHEQPNNIPIAPHTQKIKAKINNDSHTNSSIGMDDIYICINNI